METRSAETLVIAKEIKSKLSYLKLEDSSCFLKLLSCKTSLLQSSALEELLLNSTEKISPLSTLLVLAVLLHSSFFHHRSFQHWYFTVNVPCYVKFPFFSPSTVFQSPVYIHDAVVHQGLG